RGGAPDGMWLAAAQQPQSCVLPACEASGVSTLRTLSSRSQSVHVPDVTPGGVVNVRAHGQIACNCPTCKDGQGWKTAETTIGVAISLVKYYTCLYAILEHQQFFTPCPDSHHDTLRLHSALVQGEVSFSRCISSYCTTGWRLPPFLCLS